MGEKEEVKYVFFSWSDQPIPVGIPRAIIEKYLLKTVNGFLFVVSAEKRN
jgi:hypothetical protein